MTNQHFYETINSQLTMILLMVMRPNAGSNFFCAPRLTRHGMLCIYLFSQGKRFPSGEYL